MIFDKIENIKNYPQIEKIVADFVKNLNENQPVGRINLSSDGKTYANIDEYQTKSIEKCRFEAHKKYIDIQFLLSGEEIIETTYTDELEITEPYNKERDVMFMQDTADKTILHLKKGYFALFYPTDAHKPQVAFVSSKKVKKAVIKIPVLKGENK